jgi:serine/threonine protein kinase
MPDRTLADGRYELLAELGVGGMATVYKAFDTQLKVIRAIKLLDDRFSHKPEIVKRFEMEASTMAKLSDDNIVKLYNVHLNDIERFIVMDYIDGPSLLHLMQEEILDVPAAIRIMIPVLKALQVAHNNGVVHRDIKPHNILISKADEVYVSDFGIARCIDADEMSLTKTGMIMGTWAFMAPEQRADSKGVDHLADIYSAGATLYATVTGETPKDLFASEIDPSMYKSVPRELVKIIQTACAYWTSDRYPTADAMREDLEKTMEMIRTGQTKINFDSIKFRTDPEVLTAGPVPDVPAPPRSKLKAEPTIVAPSEPMFVENSGAIAEDTKRARVLVGGGVGIAAFLLAAWVVVQAPEPDVSLPPIQPEIEVELPKSDRRGRLSGVVPEMKVVSRPELQHDVPVALVLGEDFVIEASIPGTSAYDKVIAWYKPHETKSWLKTTLRRVGDGYRGSVEINRMYGMGIDYWIEAQPYHKGLPSLSHGSAKRPHQVLVVRN